MLADVERMSYLKSTDSTLFDRMYRKGLSEMMPDFRTATKESIDDNIKMIEAALAGNELMVDSVAKDALDELKKHKAELEKIDADKANEKRSISEHVKQSVPDLKFERLDKLPDVDYESVLKNPQAFEGIIDGMKSSVKASDK